MIDGASQRVSEVLYRVNVSWPEQATSLSHEWREPCLVNSRLGREHLIITNELNEMLNELLSIVIILH